MRWNAEPVVDEGPKIVSGGGNPFGTAKRAGQEDIIAPLDVRKALPEGGPKSDINGGNAHEVAEGVTVVHPTLLSQMSVSANPRVLSPARPRARPACMKDRSVSNISMPLGWGPEEEFPTHRWVNGRP